MKNKCLTVLAAVSLFLISVAYAGFPAGVNISVQQDQLFVSEAISCGLNCSYTSGVVSGTAIGTASAVLSRGSFTGSWSTSGAAGADFTFSGNQLQTNGSTPTCTSTTPLALNIVATQAGSPHPSAITVTCNPPGAAIACDVGPPYTAGVVPPAAQQAGFTHCAANYDFTQTAAWTDQTGSHQWCANGGSLPCSSANMANWLSCTNNTSSAGYLIYHEGGVPCDTSYQDIVLDGSVQTWALSLSSLNDFDTNDTAGNTSIGAGTPGIPVGFPPQMYIEQVMRPSVDDPDQQKAVYFDISSLAIQNPNGIDCMIGGDFAEQAGLPRGANIGLSGWNLQDSSGNRVCNSNTGQYWSGGGGSPSPGAASSGYQTYGALVTQDDGTSGEDSICAYYSAGAVSGLDKTKFVQCFTNFPPAANWTDVTTRQMFLYIGNPTYLWNQGQTVTPETTYIQRVTVWTCPGYATNKPAWTAGPCYTTPVITTAPP
jgi:hypothetical protein